jgi:hypothetical protein
MVFKKKEEKAKNIVVTEGMVMTTIEYIQPVLENTAVSIVKNEDRTYSVVYVKFNPTTLQSGSVTVLKEGLDMYEAQHQFKIATVEFGIFE